jgi:hypothetical protein
MRFCERSCNFGVDCRSTAPLILNFPDRCFRHAHSYARDWRSGLTHLCAVTRCHARSFPTFQLLPRTCAPLWYFAKVSIMVNVSEIRFRILSQCTRMTNDPTQTHSITSVTSDDCGGSCSAIDQRSRTLKANPLSPLPQVWILCSVRRSLVQSALAQRQRPRRATR